MAITAVVSAFNVTSFPEGGGHFWVYMQYVQGLRQLGCDVYWLECLRGRGGAVPDGAAIALFRARMERFGMSDRLILYTPPGPDGSSVGPRDYVGMERSEAEAIFERTDLLLNFHYAIDPALLGRFRRTAMVDIDPGLLQFWISRGQLAVPPHDLYITTGETVGTPAARFPDCGLRWVRTRPPICLEEWPLAPDPGAGAFTTVSNWDANDWVVDETEIYENTKRVAFLEFAELPRLTRQPLELALFLRTERDIEDRRALERLGWRVRASRDVAGSPDEYRSYIQRSRGEFSCAKRSCVKFQSAWISDRTLCYLASGKPAVVQDTGPSSFLAGGDGLLRFSTPREAAAALDRVNADYDRHSRAARQIAETYFDARLVLGKLLSDALS